jgi:hypothetical protein
MPRRKSFGLAVAVLATAAVAAPAAAGISETSTITLDVANFPTFHGKVSSPDRFCHQDRKVTLYAFGTGGKRYVFGTDETNGKGKWELSEQLDGAITFQARVKASTAKGLRCLADSSPVKSVDL